MEKKPPVLLAIDRAAKSIVDRLPKDMTPERFMGALATCCQKNPVLMTCNPASVLLAAYEAAELGIDLTPSQQYGYLIPYNGSAQFMLGYRGMIQMAYRTGVVTPGGFGAEVVYEHDFFERTFAPKKNLIHVPNKEDRGEAIGAYAFIQYIDGTFDFEYLTAKEIESHRKHSKVRNSLMWTEFWTEAWRKTCIRVIAKRLPMDGEAFEILVRAINREAERDLSITPDPPAEKQSTMATLKEKLGV
jgi:recombination protein RecT